MTDSSLLPPFITNQSDWDAVASQLAAAKRLALDLESNGYFRYPERICLLQIALPGQMYFIDPLTVLDLNALGSALADPHCLKIMHACDNDLRVLDRDYGFRVRSIYDTAVAARFLGLERLGLSTVVETLLGIELPKTKALQRQDWTLRPLSPSSLAYAAGDVASLFDLHDELDRRLQMLGRSEWVREECERLESIRRTPDLPPTEWIWTMTGSRTLTDRERAVLLELTLWRDRLCRQLNRVPFRVIGDEVLLELARDPNQNLNEMKSLRAIRASGALKSLHQALHRGRLAPPVPLPKPDSPRHARHTPQYLSRLKTLKSWRVAKGKTLGLDPAALWPMASLERMAESLQLESSNPDIRHWQYQLLARELEQILEHLRSEAKAQEPGSETT
jgi:ribonuclease D